MDLQKQDLDRKISNSARGISCSVSSTIQDTAGGHVQKCPCLLTHENRCALHCLTIQTTLWSATAFDAIATVNSAFVKGFFENFLFLRTTGSRQTEKTVDTRHWRVDWLRIQLKEMSQDRAQWRRKISEWSYAVANPHRGRSSSEWAHKLLSIFYYNYY